MVYFAGNNIIILKTDSLEQIIISGTEETLFINDFAISPSQKYIALSEFSNEMGIISIYEIKLSEMKVKKKRTFCSWDCESKTFNKLCFSSINDKLLIALTQKPNLKLTLWDWDKGKLKSIIDVTGFVWINGIFEVIQNESLIFCYGEPEEKNFSIKTFFIKNDGDEL